ncbi:MAG: class I fructose-bisphosphate aldolase [bacterium]|nr:class I fructose-bisphosphate aldolase [bacterium]
MVDTQLLNQTARALVASGKGILAADESTLTIGKRFAKINLPNDEENRRAYRELLFTTPTIGDYVSGIIMYDETIKQKTADDKLFVQVLKDQGIMVGIKVDQGTIDMPGSLLEKVTKGREGLVIRLIEYVRMGAQFAKWRAVITIAQGMPTDANIRQNAKDLAAYAKVCQEANLVPLVEPEVLMEGTHTMEQCREATERTLVAVFEEMKAAGVAIEGMILKPNMILPGSKNTEKKTADEIAEATVTLFKKVLPPNLPGVAFLSGGQDPIEATDNLNAITMNGPLPWTITFSFSRALQNPVMEKWQGKPENVIDAQMLFLWRAQMNSLAAVGTYDKVMETVSKEL